jgi:hypothetical protein
MLIVGIYSCIHVVQNAFIHNELTIFRDLNLEPIQRPRRRAFKVCPVLVEAAAMARTFEFINFYK